VPSEDIRLKIRKAEPSDSEALTKISFAAKCHWRYPEAYMKIWKEELTITPEYIQKNVIFLAVYNDYVTGFYSITENKEDHYSGEVFVEKGHWMEHIFILPSYHSMGIGSALLRHAISFCRSKGIGSLKIFSDPYAAGFYEKAGARFLCYSKSSIPGREIPVYEIKIDH